MKHTIKTILLFFVLVIAGTGHVRAIEKADIIINVQPNPGAGTVTVTDISVSTVTISAVPAPGSGYSIDANHILVEKMVDAQSRRRAPGLSSLPVTGSGNIYSFVIPEGATGAYVTVTFFKDAPIGFTAITSLSDIGLAGSYQLTADIDASGFTGLGEFTGTLDGGFHKIYNLSKPLFSSTSGNAVIRNIIFEDVNINESGDVGAVTAEAKGNTRIYNCGILPTSTERDNDDNITGFSGSSVSGSGNVGSLVGKLTAGENESPRVINCYSYANVTGGTTTAGIVGNIGYANNKTITQSTVSSMGMVMNCMFYGDIKGGSNIAPVYGAASGAMIKNDATDGVNPYCYFWKDASFHNKTNIPGIANYKRSWPAEEQNLTRFEYYRSILNSNRQLCTYWVTDKKVTDTDPTKAQTAADTALIAKWVLDPSIAPYPILKKWGKYPSVINPDPTNVWNPITKQNIPRTSAEDYQGKKLGTLKVTINAGIKHAGSVTSPISDKEYIILDMDTLNHDYGYYKIQLPYYNELFGNPTVQIPDQIPDPSDEDAYNNYITKWKNRYGGNYTDYVVTGWKITTIDDAGYTGTRTTFDGSSDKAWESGYNFADRNCTAKDLYDTGKRVFAQGGFFYVPEGVKGITIEAYWGKAVYLRNADNSIDRVNVTNGAVTTSANDSGGKNVGSPFTPAGTLPTTFLGQNVYTNWQNAIKALGEDNAENPLTVYDQAIVLVGNLQVQNRSLFVGTDLDSKWHPHTMMSVDLDMDNEPDYCFQLQFRQQYQRRGIQPIRFDFLSVPELGLAVRHHERAYAIGIFVPQGHFEITETAFMHTTQFEYDANKTGDVNGNTCGEKKPAPIILNGGNFEQIVVRYGPQNTTTYFMMGGHFWLKRFTPGSHANKKNNPKVRHCAVNVIGGEIPEFYLSGIYKPAITTFNDNPHCYINGGRFKTIAGAGMEQIQGDITFKIDHAVIDEFYGGGINSARSVLGKVDVTIDHSIVGKYCGGPKVGILGTTSNYKTVTTHATGTTFGEFYGGGNGGTSYYREQKQDGDTTFPTASASGWNNYGYKVFNPLNTQTNGTNPAAAYDNGTESSSDTDTKNNKGYHAEYEFEVFNGSNGIDANAVVRAYIQWAQFGTTTTGSVSNTLTDCIVKGNFYGGGNLGNVKGNVESELNGNTHVYGSAFGAGYSATVPSFRIHDKKNAKENVNFPTRDDAGVITNHTLDYVKGTDGKDLYYTWTNTPPPNVTAEADYKKTPVYQGADGKWYCYTWESLDNLGAVSGKVTFTIKGSTIVEGNVYGGGDASAVMKKAGVADSGNTYVILQGKAEVYGNVFGGGNNGLVEGSATVNIEE